MEKMVQHKMRHTANRSLPPAPFPRFHISSKRISRRGGMKNTSWQTLSGYYRSLYYQCLLSVDVVLDDDFLADPSYTASARSRRQMLTPWFGQALKLFLPRHCCTAACVLFAQLCVYSHRALTQQPNGKERSFSASQFSGRPDAFYRHTCCSWLQKEGNTKISSWAAFPQNYWRGGRNSMVFISEGWGLEPTMTCFFFQVRWQVT